MEFRILMNITQIQYFLAVAENGSLSAAANLLFVSQPALSVQISKLEEECGLQLFHRSPNGMTLTEDGVEFCKYAGEVIDSWKRMQENASARKGSLSGSFRIGLGPRVFSNRLFEPILSYFDRHTEIKPSLILHANDDPLTALRKGDLDIVLDRFPPLNLVPDSADFVTCELVREPYCILVSKDDPISKTDTFPFTSLNGLPFIAGLPGTMNYKIHHRDFAIANINVNEVNCSNCVDVNMAMVRLGRGVSNGPRSFGTFYGIAAVPFQPEINVALKLFYLRSNLRNPKIKSFQNYILDYCRKNFQE